MRGSSQNVCVRTCREGYVYVDPKKRLVGKGSTSSAPAKK